VSSEYPELNWLLFKQNACFLYELIYAIVLYLSGLQLLVVERVIWS